MNRESKSYKEEYLKNLQREIANIQTNERGNMNFKQFGTSTPNALPDNRTGVEKMGDTQRIINEVKRGLLEIMEPDYMTVVVNDLQKNIKILEFVYAKMPYIQRKLREKYKKESLTPALFNDELDNFINKDVVGLIHDTLLPVQADVEAESGEIDYEHAENEEDEDEGSEEGSEEDEESLGSQLEPQISENEEGAPEYEEGEEEEDKAILEYRQIINENMPNLDAYSSRLQSIDIEDASAEELLEIQKLVHKYENFIKSTIYHLNELYKITKDDAEKEAIPQLLELLKTQEADNMSYQERVSNVMQKYKPQEKLEAPVEEAEEAEGAEEIDLNELIKISLEIKDLEKNYPEQVEQVKELKQAYDDILEEHVTPKKPEPAPAPAPAQKSDIALKYASLMSPSTTATQLHTYITKKDKTSSSYEKLSLQQKIDINQSLYDKGGKPSANGQRAMKALKAKIDDLKKELPEQETYKEEKAKPVVIKPVKPVKLESEGSGIKPTMTIKPIFNHDRFEILKGEIIAGNDSKDILREFKKMLHDAVRKRLMTHDELEEYLEEIDVN